ncbi:SET domain-containing protein [Reticulomyxa filosa]|uniref:SET domain-containing protein n=1 Tax=Reticulomyxa filosa TaxID=46433 RepID=X6NIQ9_RETFI|nr:SET domain-containing protein [Reticulomyxa filosa]|eukprot:ETO25788.1 SET domain-containing protein [Reticulomyxa filosa]
MNKYCDQLYDVHPSVNWADILNQVQSLKEQLICLSIENCDIRDYRCLNRLFYELHKIKHLSLIRNEFCVKSEASTVTTTTTSASNKNKNDEYDLMCLKYPHRILLPKSIISLLWYSNNMRGYEVMNVIVDESDGSSSEMESSFVHRNTGNYDSDTSDTTTTSSTITNGNDHTGPHYSSDDDTALSDSETDINFHSPHPSLTSNEHSLSSSITGPNPTLSPNPHSSPTATPISIASSISIVSSIVASTPSPTPNPNSTNNNNSNTNASNSSSNNLRKMSLPGIAEELTYDDTNLKLGMAIYKISFQFQFFLKKKEGNMNRSKQESTKEKNEMECSAERTHSCQRQRQRQRQHNQQQNKPKNTKKQYLRKILPCVSECKSLVRVMLSFNEKYDIFRILEKECLTLKQLFILDERITFLPAFSNSSFLSSSSSPLPSSTSSSFNPQNNPRYVLNHKFKWGIQRSDVTVFIKHKYIPFVKPMFPFCKIAPLEWNDVFTASHPVYATFFQVQELLFFNALRKCTDVFRFDGTVFQSV